MTEINKQSKIEIAKSVTKIVVGSSVTFVVTNVLKNNTTSSSKIDSIKLVVGAFVLAAMVSKKANDWVDEVFVAGEEFIDNLEQK